MGAIKSTGIDVNTVTKVASSTAAEGVSAAKPVLSQTADFLTTTPPVLLAEYGAGAVALYLLAPTLLGLAAGSLRGYSGELTAAQALDAVGNDGNSILIDIRSEVRGSCRGWRQRQGAGGCCVLHLMSSCLDFWAWASKAMQKQPLPLCFPQVTAPGMHYHGAIKAPLLSACCCVPLCRLRRIAAAWLMCPATPAAS